MSKHLRDGREPSPRTATGGAPAQARVQIPFSSCPSFSSLNPQPHLIIATAAASIWLHHPICFLMPSMPYDCPHLADKETWLRKANDFLKVTELISSGNTLQLPLFPASKFRVPHKHSALSYLVLQVSVQHPITACLRIQEWCDIKARGGWDITWSFE